MVQMLGAGRQVRGSGTLADGRLDLRTQVVDPESALRNASSWVVKLDSNRSDGAGQRSACRCCGFFFMISLISTASPLKIRSAISES